MSVNTGKIIRLNRLIQKDTNSCIIIAIDHGMTSPIFLSGLYNTADRIKDAIKGGVNIFMFGRGYAKQFASSFQRDTSLALILESGVMQIV